MASDKFVPEGWPGMDKLSAGDEVTLRVVDKSGTVDDVDHYGSIISIGYLGRRVAAVVSFKLRPKPMKVGDRFRQKTSDVTGVVISTWGSLAWVQCDHLKGPKTVSLDEIEPE